MFKWLGGPRKNIPGGSLKYLFVNLKIRIFKCSYRSARLLRHVLSPVASQAVNITHIYIYIYIYNVY